MRVLLSILLSSGLTLAWGQEKATNDGPASPAKPVVKRISESKFQFGEIEFDAQSREIRFPGVVNMVDGILEYVLVHVKGKDHESLLTTKISPADLNVVMKLLRYQSGKGDLFDRFYPPGELPEREPPGDGIEMLVTWPGSIDNPVCGLIRDEWGDSEMANSPWIYTGSEIFDGRYQAELEGSIVAIYRDSLAMFNSPHPRALDDENWFPIRANIPAMETPVTIIFRPAPKLPVQPPSQNQKEFTQ